jgi:hypothetical protein
MRSILTAALAVLAAPACAAVQPARPAPEPARTVYRCHYRDNLGPDHATLTLDKILFEDGSVQSMRATWEDSNASFVHGRAPDDRGSVTLQWPGDHRFVPGIRPFDWSDGSIQIAFFGASAQGRYRHERNERWRQIVVDRSQSVQVYEAEGVRGLLLSLLDLQLTTQLDSLAGPGSLHMSLDNLLAWGAGVPRLTIYETLVSYRRYDPNSFPNDPAGRRRIVAQYDLESAALVPVVARIREVAARWEAGLGDFQTRCERSEDESGQAIVVT